jgi:hypothetical protein
MLVDFMAIRSILLPFRMFYCHLVYFVVILVYISPFWYVVPRKIWQPWFESVFNEHPHCTKIVFFFHEKPNFPTAIMNVWKTLNLLN